VTRRLEAVAETTPKPPGEAPAEQEGPSLEEAVRPSGEFAKTK
jgi:hypothetical protein